MLEIQVVKGSNGKTIIQEVFVKPLPGY